MTFYTYVKKRGKFIYIKYYDEDSSKPIFSKIEYKPTFYVKSPVKTQWKSLQGDFLKPIEQENMYEARNFLEKYKDVSTFPIYGTDNYVSSFISEVFDEEIPFDISKIVVANVDIEVESEDGFPEVVTASERICAITVKVGGKFYALAVGGDYKPKRNDVVYYRCTDEKALIKSFVSIIETHRPDIFTGWFINGFDIPYIFNRAAKINMTKDVNKLSPWGIVDKYADRDSGEDRYSIMGISILDYIELYKKFNLKKQESYRLDYIGEVEVNEKKLDYSEYGSLHNLYKNDFEKFLDYNIRDVHLVELIDNKKRFIELSITLALMTKVNFEDVLHQTRMWESNIYDYLYRNNTFFEVAKERHSKTEKYEGAVVKSPQIGMFNWVVSLDATSLYPSIMIGTNISPDTLTGINVCDKNALLSLRDSINGERSYNSFTDHMKKKIADLDRDQKNDISNSIDILLSYASLEYLSIDTDSESLNAMTTIAKALNCSMSATGELFTNDYSGFIPTLVERAFNKRSNYKNQMIEAQKKLNDLENEKQRRKLEKI